MTESGTRIVIRHLSGSKVNQIDQFDLAGLQEITLGRDPKSTVAYDVARDDEVSRRHAVIRIKNDKELYFRIADLNSSNGTMLNGERIGGEVELLPDDVVELGSGGPKFTFDVQPRPASLPSRTRAMGALDAAATRVVAATNAEAATAERSAVPETQERGVATTGTMSSTPARTPVGKATILRMLTDERRSTRQIWIAALAAVLVLAIIGGGAIWWHGQNVASQLQQQVASQAARTEAIRTEAADALSKTIGLTPADIKRLGDATVYIHNQWQLYDRDSNRPIFQKMTKVGDEWLPAYVRLDDGKLVRWLTLDNDKTNFYKPVGKDHSGSGFVISDQGFILTNKHVAAGWGFRIRGLSILQLDPRLGLQHPAGPARYRTQRQSGSLADRLGPGERRLSVRERPPLPDHQQRARFLRPQRSADGAVPRHPDRHQRQPAAHLDRRRRRRDQSRTRRNR